MKIKYLPLILLALVSFHSAGCGQNNVKSQSNANKTAENKTAVSKEIKIPSDVKKASFDAMSKNRAAQSKPDAYGFEIYDPANLNKLFNKFVADNYKK